MLSLIFSLFLSLTSRAEPTQVSNVSIPPGTIFIQTRERALYLGLPNGGALRYPVAVGKAGKGWSGTTQIDGKFLRPDWSPPADVHRDHPELPMLIRGGTPGNPMGEAAMTLAGGLYAIHGTTIKMRQSIGKAASYGCIRMYNEDVVDLFERVSVGTSVTVY